MDPVLLGLGTALCWGVADFVARFLGRAVGALTALAAVTVAGAVELSLALWIIGEPLPSLAATSHWVWSSSLITTVSLWMLYEALRRAPLSVVAPLAGAYPAWTLLLAVIVLGVRPPAAAWMAMAAVIVGMALVGGAAGSAGADAPAEPGARRLALGSGAAFAVAVLLAQEAAAVHGTAATVWYTRVIGGTVLLALVPLFGRPRLPLRWAATAAVQGTLDTGGYLFLYAAAAGLQATVTTVVSSAFGLVTVLLARIFLGERIGPPHLVGIVLVFAGIAYLSALA